MEGDERGTGQRERERRLLSGERGSELIEGEPEICPEGDEEKEEEEEEE